jgi:hypothetical protein
MVEYTYVYFMGWVFGDKLKLIMIKKVQNYAVNTV